MEYSIVIISCIVFLVILKFAFSIKLKDIKRVKELGFSKELNEITNQLPSNQEVCRSILKQLQNEKVTIKESDNNQASFYIVATNSIIIADIKNTFTRIQTIAHECLHSIQDRRTLLFNFIYSNIYLLYFLGICIATIFRLPIFPNIQIIILLFLGVIYYVVRSYLEMDAMTKAKFVAKEYIEKQGILEDVEKKRILEGNNEITTIGIKLTNFQLCFNIISKIIIYSICAIIAII